MAVGFARVLGLGQKEEQGYYAKHRCAIHTVHVKISKGDHFMTMFRRQYVKHVEIQRLVAASECERVHALKVRCEFKPKCYPFELVQHQVEACMDSVYIRSGHVRI